MSLGACTSLRVVFFLDFYRSLMILGGKGMAFVEFANELDSGRAMVELQGFRITLGIEFFSYYLGIISFDTFLFFYSYFVLTF